MTSELELFQAALVTQRAILDEQRDALGRPVMPCCGALDLGDSRHGGRPAQCLCERAANLEAAKLEEGA